MNYSLMPVKYFVDVVQTHGFSSAAKRNYVSETAVSSAVKKLEDELGHKLLNRANGQFSVTPVGEQFYKRSVEVLNAYNEIWQHPDKHPEKLLRIHCLQGLEDDTAILVRNLSNKYDLSLDEEPFETSISRLLKGYYDVLVCFELAVINNRKIKALPFRTISFDLLFNVEETERNGDDLKAVARKSKLYLQNWKSTGISDIQESMLTAYGQHDWHYKEIVGVNSFAAACLNVNFKGGLTMVPENFVIPASCENIYRYSPTHLKNAFTVMEAVNANGSKDIIHKVEQAISKSC